MEAIIKGVRYRISIAQFNDTTGPQDPGTTNLYTVYQDGYDKRGIGSLIDLGVNFGYRLVLRGNRGQQEAQELTKSDVVIIRENA